MASWRVYLPLGSGAPPKMTCRRWASALSSSSAGDRPGSFRMAPHTCGGGGGWCACMGLGVGCGDSSGGGCASQCTARLRPRTRPSQIQEGARWLIFLRRERRQRAAWGSGWCRRPRPPALGMRRAAAGPPRECAPWTCPAPVGRGRACSGRPPGCGGTCGRGWVEKRVCVLPLSAACCRRRADQAPGKRVACCTHPSVMQGKHGSNAQL